jgi:NAD(P)-dependent dehydrogenase (short-subunit alcohol dehydrogenase family)
MLRARALEEIAVPQELDGKVAVITGGASGIGLAAVELFVAEGARVVIADLDDAAGAAVVERLGDTTGYIHTDVTKEADVAASVALAVERFGKLDVMYNNAGAGGDPSPIADLTEQGFERTMALLVRSVLWGHKHAILQFRAQKSAGAIVTTDSAAGLQPGWGAASYTIAKHAVIGIVREAAAEVAAEGIRVNAVAPGITRTPIMPRTFGVPMERGAEFLEYLDEKAGVTQPMLRMARPEEIANAALWLASDRSSYVTGHTIPVAGGATDFYAGDFGVQAAAAAQSFLAS